MPILPKERCVRIIDFAAERAILPLPCIIIFMSSAGDDLLTSIVEERGQEEVNYAN